MLIRNKFILMDMDGVICNFVGGLIESHGWSILHDDWKSYYHNRQMGIDDSVMWEPTRRENWWRELRPYPGAKKFIDAIRSILSFDIIYTTAPSNDPACESEKIHWLRDHGFMDGNDYVLTPHKYLLAGSGGILVDDSQDQVNNYRNAGGNAVLFPQPWNSAFAEMMYLGTTSTQDRYQKVYNELLAIREANVVERA